MANNYEGWYIMWGPDNVSAHLVGPDGTYYGHWFQDNPELSTFDPIAVSEVLGQQVPGTYTSFVPGVSGGGAPSTGEISGNTRVGDVSPVEAVYLGLAETIEDWMLIQQEFSQFTLDMYNQQRYDQEAAWAREDEQYWERLEEGRAYSEALYAERLAEQLARQLAGQHASQEEAWQRAVMSAPSYGANILQARIPGSGTLPSSVGEALFGIGRGMGAGFSMPWPGGTELNEAQLTPTGQDWMQYIMERGFPGYVLR